MKEQYDDDVLVGFFTSISHFSREALGSAVKNIDLGNNNKLILSANHEEGLLGAMITSSDDNDKLATNILRNFMQDIIDEFSPEYKIVREKADNLLKANVKERIIKNPTIRLILSWVIGAPLGIALIYLSYFAVLYLFAVFQLDRFIGGLELFTRFIPALIVLSFVSISIVYLLPNIWLGYSAPNWRYAVGFSIIYLGFTIGLYFFLSYTTEFGFIMLYTTLGQLPLAIVFSLFFLFIGIRTASKRFLNLT